MPDKKQRYLSFLLRLWPVHEGAQTVWRASLESSHTGERWGFTTLDSLCAFIHQQTTTVCDLQTCERRCEDAFIEK